MTFDDETEFDLNEITTSNESNKKEPQLEKYGVWIKKGPENLESAQDIPHIEDDTTEIPSVEDTFAPEEQIESINEELDSLMDTEEVTPEKSDKQEIQLPTENLVTEPENDFGLPEGLDIPGIDLSAFENDSIVAPPVAKSEPEGEVSIDMDDFFSSDSGDGEVDLSSFFGDGESIDFDDFMGGDGKKKEPEIEDQEPLDIQLEFDDKFVLETKADPVSQVEFIGVDGESAEMSFDDLFDNIQDEGAAFPSDFGIESDTPKIPEVDISAFAGDDITSAFMSDSPAPSVEETKTSSEPAFDDASEFDDLLSSLDEATPLTETPEEAKHKKLNQDYDITVTMEEEDLSEEQEEEQTNDDLDDIPLFQSEEDIENFKQVTKNNGAPVGGMKVLEAQSSMDFDEIDKILEDGGFEFPSDEVKEVVVENTTEEISLDDISDVAINDISSEEISFETETSPVDTVEQETAEEISLENDFVADEIDNSSEIEVSIDDNVDFAEPNFDDNIEEESDEDELNVSFDTPDETEVADESEISIDEDITLSEDLVQDNEFTMQDDSEADNEVAIEDEVISDSEVEIEDQIALEDDVAVEDEIYIDDDISLEEDSTESAIIADPVDIVETMDVEETLADETLVEEPMLQDDSEKLDETEIQADNSLDETFSEIEETIEENHLEEVPSTEDALLDMDFSEDIPEIQENNETEQTNEDTLTEEQGETMEENNITNNAEQQVNNTSNALLEKIAAEITNLRSEITTLRDEFNSFKVAPAQEEVEDEIIENTEETEESSGFFSDDNEDETIALSGDELSNLMNNADFTTEDANETSEEEIEEVAEIENAQEEEEEAEEKSISDEFEEPIIEDSTEVISNPLGDASELNDSDLDSMDEYEDEDFADETESSDFADEDLKEPELEDLQINNGFDEEDEEDSTEEIDVPKIEEEPETNDFIESIQAEDPSISDTLTEDRLKYLEDSVDEPKDENEEKLEVDILDEDGNTVEESTEEESFEEPEVAEDELEEDETEESNEPTEDVFNSSQWDNEVPETTDEDFVEPEVAETEEITDENEVSDEENFVEPVIEEEAVSADELEEEVDSVIEEPQEEIASEVPVASPVENVKPASSATAKIQDDIKSVLVYMDQLLENLPEDKIEEFAKSEHFETYKKLFNDLGISN